MLKNNHSVLYDQNGRDIVLLHKRTGKALADKLLIQSKYETRQQLQKRQQQTKTAKIVKVKCHCEFVNANDLTENFSNAQKHNKTIFVINLSG